MKYGEIMTAKFDNKAAEFKCVEAVKAAYVSMTKSKLRFAFQCAKLHSVNKDASVYGMKYADFMHKYFGLTKASASEYASAGTMVVLEKNIYHSKFVSLEAAKYGDFSVSALLIASKNEDAFRDAFEHDCFTVFSSVANIKKALKAAETAAAETAAAETAAAETAAAETAEAETAETAATVKYNAFDVLRYHEALKALETACANNDAALKALEDLKTVVQSMTGLQ